MITCRIFPFFTTEVKSLLQNGVLLRVSNLLLIDFLLKQSCFKPHFLLLILALFVFPPISYHSVYSSGSQRTVLGPVVLLPRNALETQILKLY